MAFSSNLKYLMDYFDVSNYKLAQYIKSSQTSVKNWVSGERLPHPKTQKLIAELFGVTVEELNADEFPHIKGEHKLPLQKKARPSPEGAGRRNLPGFLTSYLRRLRMRSLRRC